MNGPKGIPRKWTIGTKAKINMITKPTRTPLIIVRPRIESLLETPNYFQCYYQSPVLLLDIDIEVGISRLGRCPIARNTIIHYSLGTIITHRPSLSQLRPKTQGILRRVYSAEIAELTRQ
jgi:hypothetical protein